MCQNDFSTKKRPNCRSLITYYIFILSRMDNLAEHKCLQKPLLV